MRRNLVYLVMFAACSAASAQSSESFKITDDVFNQGGHPESGTVLTSANYRISLDSVGDGIIGRSLSSTSFRMDGGFVPGYPPPGEVTGLELLEDEQTLEWDPEWSVGVYNLYRGELTDLSGLGYGSCEQYGIADETTTDPVTPPSDNGFYYLVTAENRLSEEGTKGWDSEDNERQNLNPCP